MDANKKMNIVYVLIGILCLGQVYLLYAVGNLRAVGARGASTAGQNSNTSASSLADISVGNNPVVDTVSGVVVEVSGSTLKVKEQGSNVVDTVSTSAQTEVVLVGPLKSNTTRQKELAAYNAQVTELMKDPVANKAALLELKIPSPQVRTPIPLSSIQVGDSVSVATPDRGVGDSFVATVVAKLTVSPTASQ